MIPPIVKSKAKEIGRDVTKNLSKDNNNGHMVAQNKKKSTVIDR